jgi:asparagine synthase (glutamine-hydrolysing)
MCGIAGYTGPLVPGRLEAMIGALVHRGPDDEGSFHDERVHMGMRRLSIVDLATGRQPKASHDGRVVVVFNGEIYNHVELRAELESRGCRFESEHSDTETIVHAWLEYGVDMLERFVGMFAIALYDFRTSQLYLFRDRLGKKPIFYCADQSSFSWASEPNALLLPERPAHIDRASVAWYFSQKTSPGDRSADDRIRKLPAGCYLKIDLKTDGENRIETRRYWSISAEPRTPVPSDEDATRELEALLTDSIRLRMRADVEVGSYLSGGVDSSLGVALASQFTPRPLKTYCLVYDEEIGHKSSDRHFARLISERYGTHHHEVPLGPALLAEDLPRIVAQYGQPNSAVISSWFVSRAMAKDIKVALSGDGADELFGSYFLHRVAGALSELERDPSAVDRLLPAEATFARENRDVPYARLVERFGVFTDDELRSLLRPDVYRAGAVLDRFAALEAELSSKDQLDRALEFDCRNLLCEQVLNYSDVLAMAFSIEVRTPFLDHRIVDFAFSLPASVKIRRGETKWLLKRVARRHLPEELVLRPKEGFVEPAVYWLSRELRDFWRDRILGASFDRLGLLQPDYARAVATRFDESGDFFLGKKVWSLLVYALWEENVLAS